MFHFRSFPLHFDENSFFAGNKKEAAKLKVIVQPFPLGYFVPTEYFGCVWNKTASERDPVGSRNWIGYFQFILVWGWFGELHVVGCALIIES